MNNNNKFSLRPLTDNDADSLARQLNNKKVWDNLRDALPYPYTSQDAAWFINFQQNDPLLTCYGIVVDGEVVGNIGFTRSEDIERFTAEVGYYIGEDYWGQGIMSAALSEAVEDYFKTTEVVRLFATPFDYNKASAKVLEKAGFTLKCIFTKARCNNRSKCKYSAVKRG
jgi:ribosomal-protein-alanine N-acetyltransferase